MEIAILFAADVAAEVSRRLGRPVTPREVTALFYHRKVPDELGPVVGGRRVIRPEAVEIITALLRNNDTSPEGGCRMTTVDADALIPLTRVPGLNVIPPRRGNTRLHVRTVFRWALTGVRGVRLRTSLVGGQRCTTLACLHAFFRAVDAARETPPGRPLVERPTRPRSIVDADLDRLGL